MNHKLPVILAGEAKPADVAECLALAQFCRDDKQLYAAAVRFYTEAFTTDAKLQRLHRYNAACAAALAGCGKGMDANQLEEKERLRLRKQALDWLKADLFLWAKHADSDQAEERTLIVQGMKHWQTDPNLAGVRDKDDLAKLPAEVETLRLKAGEKAK
jgi:hypothetical protein